MPGKEQPQSRDDLIRDLTQRAVNLWGQERTLALRERIERTADQMLTVSKNLPHFEKVPTLTWQNRP